MGDVVGSLLAGFLDTEIGRKGGGGGGAAERGVRAETIARGFDEKRVSFLASMTA